MTKYPYTAWKWKYELRITNPSSIEGQQAAFYLYYKPGMRSDFRDVRISDKHGNPLNFYIEYYTAFYGARIWIKLPANETLLYLYHGNGRVAHGSTAETFEFFDDFNRTTLDTSKWTVYNSAVSHLGSYLKVGSSTNTRANTATSIRTFGEGYRVIIRAQVPYLMGYREELGFLNITDYNYGTCEGVGWVSPTSFLYNTGSVTTSNYSGAYHLYDISRKGSGNSRLIVDGYVIVSNQSGSKTGDLPIVFAASGRGTYLYINYVLVVKYAAVEPVITLGRRCPIPLYKYPSFYSLTDGSISELSAAYSMTDYFSAPAANLSLKPGYSFSVPNYYRTTISGPFQNWKFKGAIQVNNPSSTDGVQADLFLNVLPGMAIDGRDLRFTDLKDNPLNYYIESIDSGVIHVWVKLPANESRINFYYGNGTATSESSDTLVFDFVERFDSATLDGNIWTSQGSPTISNSVLTVYNGSADCRITSILTYQASILEYRAKFYNTGLVTGGYWSNLTFCYLPGTGMTANRYNGSTMDVQALADTSGAYHTYGITRRAGTNLYYVDYALQATPNLTTIDDLTAIEILFWNNATGPGKIDVDWVRIRKSVDLQPTLTVLRHSPQATIIYSYYSGVDDSGAALTLSASDATITDFHGIEDFSLISATIKKSINDSYWTFSASFADSLVPDAGSPIKFSASDSLGTHFLFYGKAISNNLTLGYLGEPVSMDGADRAQGLAIQKIPWDARVIELNSTFMGWDSWINYLANYTVNKLVPRVVNRPSTVTTQFSLDPKVTRLEAIKKIADYCNYLFFVKFYNQGTLLSPDWINGVYFLDPADIDNSVGGLDLPAPLTLTTPDASLLDLPSLTPDLENNYNTVTIYGTLSSDNTFYAMSACTSEVALGNEEIREYVLEDNSITEKGSSFTAEAVKWLLYFIDRQASVKLKFIDRFDLELYQRLRFDSTWPSALYGLTNRPPLETIRVYDPRDPVNYQDVDVSGVPRPSWLRITEINYNCGALQNITEVTAVVDFIYSNSDPYVDPAWSQFIGSGYIKPSLSDSTVTTQSMIDNTLSKQAKPVKGTILSISGNTAQVLTSDGKTITAAVVSTVTAGSSVLVIPGSAGYYIS